MIRWFNHFGIGAAVLLFAASAGAAPREGTVVAIDNGDLIVDVGESSGATAGSLVELWRPLKVKHPVTGQVLVDRFQIGTLRLLQVRSSLSLAKTESTMRQPAAGDVVVLPHAAEPEPPKPTSPASAIAPSPSDPEAKELSDLFTSLRGTPPRARIAAYGAYVRSHPASRFAPVVREEAEALEHAIDENAKPAEQHADPSPEFDGPSRAHAGRPLTLSIELAPRFTGAVAHVRQPNDDTYASVPMKPDGARYFSAIVAASAVRTPSLEYFIEGVGPDGVASTVVGTPQEPRSMTVDEPDTVRPLKHTKATIAASTDYASFDARNANDFVWQTEGTVGLRFQDVGIRAVRSGFGVYRGRGGTLHELDDLHQPGRAVGLTYGYLEGELGFDPRYALVGRAIIGLREDGVDGGAQGFFRVGNDLSTNLLIGGEVLGGIGLRGIVELDWNTFRRVPIVLRTEVTNQPAGAVNGDVAARAIAQAGYRFGDTLTVSARVSYQGRTINHAGPGAGAAVSYQW